MIKFYVVLAASIAIFAAPSWALEITSADVVQCGGVSACDEMVSCETSPTNRCCDARPTQTHCGRCCKKKSGSFFSNLMELERRKNKWILENILGVCR